MKIGFCGVGLMGQPIVHRLLRAGHTVHVWNRTSDKLTGIEAAGAIVEPDPATLASQTDAVHLCLMNALAVEEVVFGPKGIAHGHGAQLLIDHSSIDPKATRQFSDRLLNSCGMTWIDAPVSGDSDGAAAGTLAIMAGGPSNQVAQAATWMSAYAARTTHMGDVGSGQVTKLCNQTIVAASIVAFSEAIGLASNSGIDASLLIEALSGGWADSRLFQIFMRRMTSPPTDFIGAVSTMLKDVDTAAELARETYTATPVSAAVQQTLRLAASLGMFDADLSRIVELTRHSDRSKKLFSQ